jgi:glutathione S-transferase
MNNIVLHHYPASPFAEKARLMLGYKGLAWKSVFIPMVMPKPDVMALTGGYRKTPILQVGADIYCDTALIAQALDELVSAPALMPAAVQGLAGLLAQWADATLFWASMSYSTQAAGMAQMFAKAPPQAVQGAVQLPSVLQTKGERQLVVPLQSSGAMSGVVPAGSGSARLESETPEVGSPLPSA